MFQPVWVANQNKLRPTAERFLIIIYFANVGSTQYTGNKQKRIN